MSSLQRQLIFVAPKDVTLADIEGVPRREEEVEKIGCLPPKKTRNSEKKDKSKNKE